MFKDDPEVSGAWKDTVLVCWRWCAGAGDSALYGVRPFYAPPPSRCYYVICCCYFVFYAPPPSGGLRKARRSLRSSTPWRPALDLVLNRACLRSSSVAPSDMSLDFWNSRADNRSRSPRRELRYGSILRYGRFPPGSPPWILRKVYLDSKIGRRLTSHG